MKKFILLLLFAALVQSSLAQHFQFGLKAGANISNFTGGDFDAVKKKALVGFHGGLYLKFKIASFGLQPEIMVSTQGAKIDSVSGSYDWKVTYINVPVMAQFYLKGGFYMEAGPQVGFKLSDDFGSSTLNDFAKNLDLSVAAGLGYRGKAGFGLGARYTAGLSKIGDFSPSNGVNPDFKNGVIQFSIYIPLTPRGK
ncbi:MAG: PorT family protein [Sphingobacteriales bacterium]|nr:PorT family protein [Sphingobacteriales bacterium]